MIDLPTTDGGWQVIISDPPWKFSSNSAAKPGRNARRHYDCMTLDDICAMPVQDIAAKDALLLMWITVPFAHFADRVVEAWGFKSKSQLVWVKDRPATGFWAMNQHEICVIARRGKFPCVRPAMFPTSIIPGAQREHSRKPEWLHQRVEAVHPDARKLEMFARRPRDGWTVWGNEIGKFEAVA